MAAGKDISKLWGDYVQIIGGKETRVLSYVWDGLHTMMDEMSPYANDPSLKYIVTGHSLGGALGTLYALLAKYKRVSRKFLDQIRVIFTINGGGGEAL